MLPPVDLFFLVGDKESVRLISTDKAISILYNFFVCLNVKSGRLFRAERCQVLKIERISLGDTNVYGIIYTNNMIQL